MHKGQKHTPATIKKIVKARTRYFATTDALKKMSESKLALYAARRAAGLPLFNRKQPLPELPQEEPLAPAGGDR